MAKTSFERFDAGGPGSAGFRVSGTLGFHENTKVEQLVAECLKREFEHVVFDFSALESLGGGVARILRGFVRQMNELGRIVAFVITSDVIQEFLIDEKTPIIVCGTVSEAVARRTSAVNAAAGAGGANAAADSTGGAAAAADPTDDANAAAETTGGAKSCGAGEDAGSGENPGVIHMSYESSSAGDDQSPQSGGPEETSTLGNMIEPRMIDFGAQTQGVKEASVSNESAAGGADRHSKDPALAGEVRDLNEPAPGGSGDGATDSGAAGDSGASAGPAGEKSGPSADGTVDGGAILSEIFGPVESKVSEPRADGAPPASGGGNASETGDLNRRLKRRILELRTLFSISSDFNAIRDRKRLLDIFLLTSIAQGGVESAVFYEKSGEIYEPVMSKGVESGALGPIRLTDAEESSIRGSAEVTEIDRIPLAGETRDLLMRGGMVYLCPFHHDEGLTSIVMLGRRIVGRGLQKEDFEFLQVLVNLARGAYRNALLFEHEHERTLGIVKTLISLIEENTLLKGTSEFVSRYVGMVAKDMDYPDEHFTDLIYGTVLRDMGMIKVSDLIVRSPRELTKDEWQIIKRHPEDGAEMLRRMRFSGRVIDIVLSHHERFNGEGYPRGLRGKDIPTGARIISVVESYAAMINERPNRPALSEREALDTLRENYGLRYDRDIVNHFVAIMEKEIAKAVKPVASVM